MELLIPELDVIPRNFVEFLPVPVSLNSGIPSRNWVITRWVSDNRIIIEVPIPEFPELDGTGSGAGTDSGMFNIAE